MSVVFADTFYWIAFTNILDAAHEKAKALALKRSTILTTEEVLIEYLNYFAAWGENFRRKALVNTRNIMANKSAKVVPQTPASFLHGLELYGARLDKGYSLTDCISMQTMRAEGITDALTNDVHFEQEGFRALFRDS
jgi:predicted nucleic acid-binding protein